MQRLIFYTKLNCPLCDEAYQILMNLALDVPLEIDIIDIAHSPNLQADYKNRIPVIALPGAKTELNWPFTHNDIKVYLNPQRA